MKFNENWIRYYRAKKLKSLICVLLLGTLVLQIIPKGVDAEASSDPSGVIGYQVGTMNNSYMIDWSPQAWDGETATVFNRFAPFWFYLKAIVPEAHVKYQIGSVLSNQSETWSAWTWDGEVAEVTTTMVPLHIMIKMVVPDGHVEYQIGTIRRDTGETWSPWMSDGEVAGIICNLWKAPDGLNVSIRAKAIPPEYENIPPVADIEPNYQVVYVGNTALFDASQSYDQDGTIVSYSWDFGDSSQLGSGVTTSHIYSEPGNYTVTLTVTDNENATGTDTAFVVVLRAPYAILDITKVKISGPDKVYTHTYYEWELKITVTNLGGCSAEEVVVKDVLPAELKLLGYTLSQGTLEIVKKGRGRMGATHFRWYVGHLGAKNAFCGAYQAELVLKIALKKNPAGKQEFTSPGIYILNDGARVEGIDSFSGEEISAGPTEPISVIAIDKCNSALRRTATNHCARFVSGPYNKAVIGNEISSKLSRKASNDERKLNDTPMQIVVNIIGIPESLERYLSHI